MGDGEMESPVGEGEQAEKTVVLFGSSLAVSSIGASLQGCAGLRVLAVDGAAHGAAQRLRALRPDVVLFDLAAVPSDFAIDLWKARPSTLLIGMDLLAGKALVLSGRPTLARTTGDLLELIRRHKAGGRGNTETRGRGNEERVTKVGIAKGTKGERT